MYHVIFYEDGAGRKLVKEYLLELKSKATSSKNDRILFNKINTYLRTLEQYGTRVGSPTVKHIDGDIWELRPLNNRIFFFYWKDDTFVLLHHFIKKSQKTPKKEIEQARSNLENFLNHQK